MAARRSTTEPAAEAVRRAPFSDNPAVGTRGRRTQQRILDAALEVFGEHGYERSTLDRIGQVAGCSRVSIYQYFSGKDDVFRHLAGRVATEMRASGEAMAPVTADAAGRVALHDWVARYLDIHARSQAVFRAFGTAAQTDAELAGGSARIGERNLARLRSKLDGVAVPGALVEPVVSLLHSTVTRSLDIGSILTATLPEVHTPARLADAVADVVHRSLFGPVEGVNARPPGDVERAPALRIAAELLAEFDRADELGAEAGRADRRALASMLAVGQEVIVARGYQGTRVDDVVAAAGVSHGAFYRYFRNIADFVRVVAVGALASVSSTLAEIPAGGDQGDAAARREWLGRYNAVHAEKGAMIRVWTEAADDPMWSDRAGVFDWGRRQAARLLRSRPFGDHDTEGIVLLAMVDAFGSIPRTAAELDAAAYVVERGFLGT